VPELPDLEAYRAALIPRVVGEPLELVRLASPFLLRTVEPPVTAAFGRRVRDVRRVGKRIALALDDDLFLAVHLMIAGRFRWRPAGAAPPGRVGLAAFRFPKGTLVLTEASTRKRAALHVVQGEEALRALDAGGLEPLATSAAALAAALRRTRRTLKRALTDPATLAGVGNAYSDEILHRARLSPVAMTTALDDAAMAGLHAALRDVLTAWTTRLVAEAGDRFPEQVTAFRDDFAVHGRHGRPCPVCGATVQRIVRGEHETNYCPGCQTGGQLLADRALSKLLHGDWPKTLEEWEERRGGG
jgi:formamidopyrimidine-DNA glycosylase